MDYSLKFPSPETLVIGVYKDKPAYIPMRVCYFSKNYNSQHFRKLFGSWVGSAYMLILGFTVWENRGIWKGPNLKYVPGAVYTHLTKVSLTTRPGNLSYPQMVAGEKRQASPRASCLVGGELIDRANNLWWSSLVPEASLLSWCSDQGRAALHTTGSVVHLYG